VPGAFMSIAGEQFGDVDLDISEPPYPTFAEGMQVLINGVAAPITSVRADRVGFIVPWALGGSTAVVRVSKDGIPSDPIVRPVARVLPRISTVDLAPASHSISGSDHKRFAITPVLQDAVLLQLSDLSLVTPQNPAVAGEAVVLIAKNLGVTEPPLADGQSADDGVTRSAAANIRVNVGTIAGTVFSTGLTMPRLDEYAVAFIVPFDVQSGERRLTLFADGVASNVTKSYFRAFSYLGPWISPMCYWSSHESEKSRTQIEPM